MYIQKLYNAYCLCVVLYVIVYGFLVIVIVIVTIVKNKIAL